MEMRTAVPTRLTIGVAAGRGEGPTALAAFDDALRAVGVANLNLVRLSSVIPPGSVVQSLQPGEQMIDLTRAADPPSSGTSWRWGDRLYAVWAFQSAEILGQEAWAGVAWAQDPADGRGLFVEHEGASEAQVRDELDATLDSICASRSMGHLERQSVVVGTRCNGRPVGALVMAPFTTMPW